MSTRNLVLARVLDNMRLYIQGSLADAIQITGEVECEVSPR